MLLALACTASLLISCAGVSQRLEQADTLAARAGFQKVVLDTVPFKLLSYQRIRKPGVAAVIYIEGDGLAFMQRNDVSPNPTPVNPVGLKLALLDNAENVIYLARPCQYVPTAENPECRFEFWTTGRYAPIVIRALNQAIEYDKRKFNLTGTRLVGYSGGGAVAAILAAWRNDIIDLRTLAGNLDTVDFARSHRVTPLSGSLNPADYAADLIHVPQVHWVGGDDNVITDVVTGGYVSSLRKIDSGLRCVTIMKMKGVGHNNGWEKVWGRNLHTAVKCK